MICPQMRRNTGKLWQGIVRSWVLLVGERIRTAKVPIYDTRSTLDRLRWLTQSMTYVLARCGNVRAYAMTLEVGRCS